MIHNHGDNPSFFNLCATYGIISNAPKLKRPSKRNHFNFIRERMLPTHLLFQFFPRDPKQNESTRIHCIYKMVPSLIEAQNDLPIFPPLPRHTMLLKIQLSIPLCEVCLYSKSIKYTVNPKTNDAHSSLLSYKYLIPIVEAFISSNSQAKTGTKTKHNKCY